MGEKPNVKAVVEHREHVRTPIELEVSYRKLNSFFADYTKNISKGGTFIRTKRTLPVGTRFLFHLKVPGREIPFELNGEVIHASPSGDNLGMGIRFMWAADLERMNFEDAVEKLLKESLGPFVAQRLMGKS